MSGIMPGRPDYPLYTGYVKTEGLETLLVDGPRNTDYASGPDNLAHISRGAFGGNRRLKKVILDAVDAKSNRLPAEVIAEALNLDPDTPVTETADKSGLPVEYLLYTPPLPSVGSKCSAVRPLLEALDPGQAPPDLLRELNLIRLREIKYRGLHLGTSGWSIYSKGISAAIDRYDDMSDAIVDDDNLKRLMTMNTAIPARAQILSAVREIVANVMEEREITERTLHGPQFLWNSSPGEAFAIEHEEIKRLFENSTG